MKLAAAMVRAQAMLRRWNADAAWARSPEERSTLIANADALRAILEALDPDTKEPTENDRAALVDEGMAERSFTIKEWPEAEAKAYREALSFTQGRVAARAVQVWSTVEAIEAAGFRRRPGVPQTVLLEWQKRISALEQDVDSWTR